MQDLDKFLLLDTSEGFALLKEEETGKMDMKTYNRGRNDGLVLALKIVKESGEEGLAREIKYRGLTGISLNMTEKELTQGSIHMKVLIIKTVLCLAVAVLRDEFEFGRMRLNRFIKRFMLKTNCLEGGWTTWAELKENILDETGIEIDFGDSPVTEGELG